MQGAQALGYSLRLFTFSGITVYLHWSWFLVAYFEIVRRVNPYSSLAWNILEYVALFGIVVLHEFGHALACRQVGGQADRIVLWPLGGVAFVNPPPRPGPTLWSIAAGPLVNVALVPVTVGLWWLAAKEGWFGSHPDAYRFIRSMAAINLVLLIFNLLPIYPLDGGRILQSLLWIFLGRSRSMRVATVIGVLCGIAGVGVAIGYGQTWLGIMAGFIALSSAAGYYQAERLGRPGVEPLIQGNDRLIRGRDYAGAIEEYNRAIEQLPPEDAALAAAYVGRGGAYLQLGEHAKAIADLSEALRRRAAPEYFFLRAQAYAQANQPELTIADCNEVLKHDSGHIEALLCRGLANHHTGNDDAAIADLTNVLQIDPDNLEALTNRAVAWMAKHDDDAAIADCTQALRREPRLTAAYCNRAKAYLRKGLLEEASADCTAAIEIDPRFVLAYINRGVAESRMGNYEHAQADYLRALCINPKHANAYNNLAWVLATCPVDALRDGSRAVEYATKALELTGGRQPSVLGTLAAAQAEVGRFDEAIRWQEKALADPGYSREQGDKAQLRLQLYREGKPFHEEPRNVQVRE
jgi:tetratricopeptide (TPR) repeat protein/Zn-dependent protease